MIQYKIKPRLIKRWFRKPKLIFELIEIEKRYRTTYLSGGVDVIDYEEETVIFKSENLEEVKNIKNSLQDIN
jgi:hypothetical protein